MPGGGKFSLIRSLYRAKGGWREALEGSDAPEGSGSRGGGRGRGRGRGRGGGVRREVWGAK